MMRICMVAYAFYDTDTRIKRYAETLVQNGHEVDAISLGRDGQADRGVLNGVNVYRIQKRIRNEKSKISYFSRTVRFLVLSSIFLTKKHLEKRYDIVHVHNVPDFEVFAAWFPKLTGAKIILDIHDILPEFYVNKYKIDKHSLTYKLLLFIEKRSSGFSDHVIIANHLWHKTITSRSIPQNKCTTIMNYPDLDFICHNRSNEKRENDKFIIVYPGSLNYHQGLDIAIRAINILQKNIPKVELHIYGEGPAKESLISLVKELSLEKQVFIKDHISNDEIINIMKHADLGIVPKRADSFGNEAFSTKILEFMALGVPVVVSATKIDQYYFDESMVKFFKSDNDRDLSDAILVLMKDQDLRKRLVENSQKYIRENNWEIKKHVYIDIIKGLSWK